MNNQDIADIFDHIADILELQKVEFKPRAYQKAAMSIRALTTSLQSIAQEGKLNEIPGVGKAIAEKISELINTGKLTYYDELKKQLPNGLLELFDIPNIGPKSISRLYHELGITSLKELEKAVHLHKVASLKGFGHKTEYEILEGIALVKAGQKRMLLGLAYPIAQSIKEKLQNIPDVTRVDIVGSLSRMQETIGDIDLLCIAKDHQKVMDVFTSMPSVTKILAKGNTKSSILIKKNIQVDLRVLDKNQYGSALQYFIGSKQHGVHLRNLAIEKGYKLSEYGLFERATDKLIESADEKKIYANLGLQWVPPEMREDFGEIEAALKNKIPHILPYDALKGDFHMHTTHSDGANTIQEMAHAADILGYEYIAITDHTKSTAIAHGNTEKEIQIELKEIKKVDSSSKVKVFSGSEVDILSDGKLDFNNDTLKKLDVVIASIHSGFKKDNTHRLLKAIDNRYVTCIGHLTGRLINQRNPYPLDIDKILQSAKDNNVAIEINAQPLRLDANAHIIRKGIEIGCRFMINSDAHSTDGLNMIKYGIGTSRKGWATKNDVVNAWDLSKVEKYLNR